METSSTGRYRSKSPEGFSLREDPAVCVTLGGRWLRRLSFGLLLFSIVAGPMDVSGDEANTKNSVGVGLLVVPLGATSSIRNDAHMRSPRHAGSIGYSVGYRREIGRSVSVGLGISQVFLRSTIEDNYSDDLYGYSHMLSAEVSWVAFRADSFEFVLQAAGLAAFAWFNDYGYAGEGYGAQASIGIQRWFGDVGVSLLTGGMAHYTWAGVMTNEDMEYSRKAESATGILFVALNVWFRL